MTEPDRSSELGHGVIVNTGYDHVRTQDPTSNHRRLRIDPHGPFRLDLTAWALRRHARNAVDRWDAATYTRVMSLDDGPVALSVTQAPEPAEPRLSVLLAGRPIDTPAETLALSALNRLLGLTVDLSPFAAMAASDPLLGPLAARMRGLRPPRFPAVFEALVNGVACQQLSLAVGIQLLNRLAADRGKATPDSPDGPRAFPDPDDLASLEPTDLKRHGFSSTKARTIIEDRPGGRRRRLDLEALAGTRMARRSSA